MRNQLVCVKPKWIIVAIPIANRTYYYIFSQFYHNISYSLHCWRSLQLHTRLWITVDKFLALVSPRGRESVEFVCLFVLCFWNRVKVKQTSWNWNHNITCILCEINIIHGLTMISPVFLKSNLHIYRLFYSQKLYNCESVWMLCSIGSTTGTPHSRRLTIIKVLTIK